MDRYWSELSSRLEHRVGVSVLGGGGRGEGWYHLWMDRDDGIWVSYSHWVDSGVGLLLAWDVGVG